MVIKQRGKFNWKVHEIKNVTIIIKTKKNEEETSQIIKE